MARPEAGLAWPLTGPRQLTEAFSAGCARSGHESSWGQSTGRSGKEKSAEENAKRVDDVAAFISVATKVSPPPLPLRCSPHRRTLRGRGVGAGALDADNLGCLLLSWGGGHA